MYSTVWGLGTPVLYVQYRWVNLEFMYSTGGCTCTLSYVQYFLTFNLHNEILDSA